MTSVTLQQVLEALGKATPGEWHCSKNGRVVGTKNDTGFCRHIAENAWPSHPSGIADMEAIAIAVNWLRANAERLRELERDSARLDYIERTFSGMTNRERYLPVKMIWGNGASGRTLREACDKYMARNAIGAEGR